ncbi:MAG: glycosyltransferase family 2 protein [Pseudobdellovibrionaceae bacterium]
MKFSVVTPAHNEEKFIGACLQSIQAAAKTSGHQVEMIVVLNRCSDQTETIARHHGAVIVKEDEKNIARVRNTGAKVATGDVIVTLDADSRMDANTFIELERLLKSGKFVGGGARVKPERWSIGIFMSLLSIAPYVIAKGVSVGMFWCYRKDFEAIHGFDESMVSLEDADFGQRLKKLGATRGLSYGTARRVPIVTSCRKFDKFGDWYLFLNPRLVHRIFKGTDRMAADSFYYDVNR